MICISWLWHSDVILFLAGIGSRRIEKMIQIDGTRASDEVKDCTYIRETPLVGWHTYRLVLAYSPLNVLYWPYHMALSALQISQIFKRTGTPILDGFHTVVIELSTKECYSAKQEMNSNPMVPGVLSSLSLVVLEP